MSILNTPANLFYRLKIHRAKSVWTGGSKNSSGDMHEAHFERIYEMLVEFDEFCMENDLKYSLAFGTLLGAVRHKGFIPWDHDADLFMDFQDYKRMRKLFDEGKGPKNRILLDRWNTPGYMKEFGRFMDTSATRFNPRDTRGLAGDAAGIFIDIFPLLPMRGRTEEELDRFAARFQCFCELRTRTGRLCTTRSDMFYEEWHKICADVDERGRDAVLADLEKEIYSVPYDTAQWLLHPSGGPAYGWRFRKENFQEFTRVDMMGHDCTIPKHCTEILTTMYGPDYRYYPSERSLPVGRNLFTSLKVPTQVFQDEAAQCIDLNAMLELRDHAKDLRMEENVRYHEMRLRERKLVVIQQQLHVKQRKESLGLSPLEALESSDWAALDDIFNDYYAVQTDPSTNKLKIYVPLDDDDYHAALMNLVCHKASNGLAYKLVNRLLEQRSTLSKKQQATVDFMMKVFSVRDALEEGDPDRCRELVDEVLAVDSRVIDALACDLWLRIHHGATPATEEELLAVADEAAAHFRETGLVRFEFLQAEALWKMGRKRAAKPLYQDAREKSIDGFLLRTIDEKIGGEAR